MAKHSLFCVAATLSLAVGSAACSSDRMQEARAGADRALGADEVRIEGCLTGGPDGRFVVKDLPVFEEAWNRGGKDALIEAVPDSYVEGMTASGTPEEVKARIEEYREAGVDLPILRPAAAHQTQRLLDLFAPEQAAAPA